MPGKLGTLVKIGHSHSKKKTESRGLDEARKLT